MSDPNLAFLAGNAAMARLMRAHDWSGSALGPPRQWPQSLRSVVNLILGSAFPMFVAWGPRASLLYNDGYAELLGVKHPAALGQPLLDVWHEIRGDLVPLVERALGGEAFYMENLPLRLRRRGYDEDTWFTFSYSPVQDDNAAIAGLFCACTETTALVLAERHQRAGQERLKMLFDQAPGFAAVVRGPDHVIEMANRAYLELIGFRDVMGKPVAQVLPEAVDQGFVKLLDDVLATGVPFVGRAMPFLRSLQPDALPTEAFVDFIYQPVTDGFGKVEGVFVQGHDSTEQHRAQQALLAFSNSIPAIAWVAAPDGTLERFNSQWSSYTGQSAEIALGLGWVDALHPDDREAPGRAFDAARRRNAEWQVEYRLRRHDGQYRWFLTRAVPQLDASGRVLRWFGTTTDIEEARRSAEALRDADRQKDEFLATLAHELRNPLAPIRTAAHLLAAPQATEAVRLRASEVISRQVGHMSRLLDDLIDIARITQRRLLLKPERVSVQSLVDVAIETARPWADAKRHALTATIDDPAARVTADPVRLAQVLSNLLHNASKYTDAGGRIALDVRTGGTQIAFTVTDSGIGLSREAMKKVFDMFAQEQSALDRSEGGLGIGLALAKGLVELHGGTLSAHSEGAGLGASFVVKLPVVVAATTALSVPRAAVAPARPAVAHTVLLADDNRDAADILAELLRMDGHVVHIAADGLAAVDLAMRFQPDALILDIGMPGLNGYEVARRVRAQAWAARSLLIAATGWDSEEARRTALEAGFDLHLTKPFDPEQITTLIAERFKPAP